MTQRNGQGLAKKTKLFIGLNLIIFFFFVVAFGREYVGHVQIERELKQLEEQRAALEDEQLSTLSLIADLSSEYYLESEARTKHGLAREGETLIVVTDTIQAERDVLGVTDDSLTMMSNPAKWFFYFFDPSQLPRNESL